jgi:addiction module RelE/StbE family toxin
VEYHVILSQQALRDLELIYRYIASDNPTAAESFCARLLRRCEQLSQFPQRGGHVRERAGVRFVIVGSYLIAYRIDDEQSTVRVLRFWHGARDRSRFER